MVLKERFLWVAVLALLVSGGVFSSLEKAASPKPAAAFDRTEEFRRRDSQEIINGFRNHYPSIFDENKVRMVTPDKMQIRSHSGWFTYDVSGYKLKDVPEEVQLIFNYVMASKDQTGYNSDLMQMVYSIVNYERVAKGGFDNLKLVKYLMDEDYNRGRGTPISHIENIYKNNPSGVKENIMMAYMYSRINNKDKARQFAQEALNRNPTDEEDYLMLYESYNNIRDNEGVVKILESASIKFENNLFFNIKLANIYEDQGESDKAEKIYLKFRQ